MAFSTIRCAASLKSFILFLWVARIVPLPGRLMPIASVSEFMEFAVNIPDRTINVKLTDEELAAREQRPMTRQRTVSKALRAYAQSVSSADKGGVRIIE
jgi:dihydroxyacid dehydratase/phosphogluconate dehydratase